MKRIIVFIIATLVFIYISLYLYNHSLGAIPFLLLSIFFFSFASREWKKGKKKVEKGLKKKIHVQI
ncbi:hypothetical protein [Bacillus sp. 2205SS5-2]|uniref:hypothetical protein n=1 Tax=Bacillus sp. 2205SS5-2 TaxID=3109031 RepID=UPI0030056242